MAEYPFTVRPLDENDGGGWLVEFLDLPGCMADGATLEEAIAESRDALASYLGALADLGRPIPPPSKQASSASGRWVVQAPRYLHRRLAERARAEGVSLNQLTVALLAEGSIAQGGVTRLKHRSRDAIGFSDTQSGDVKDTGRKKNLKAAGRL